MYTSRHIFLQLMKSYKFLSTIIVTWLFRPLSSLNQQPKDSKELTISTWDATPDPSHYYNLAIDTPTFKSFSLNFLSKIDH